MNIQKLICCIVIVFAAVLVLKGEREMPTLSWMGRKEATNVTKNVIMKILREDKELSYAKDRDDVGRGERVEHGEEPDLFGRVEVEKGRSSACPTTDNILVHGDNLEALHALLPFYAGQVKCIYIDPPYNTGNMFENYDDNLEHSTWLSVMYPRLKLLKDFLTPDGNFFMQLDDNELDYAKVICDEIFGRKNFVNRITIDVRAPSAFSTVNPGVFKCSEYILWYANDKSTVPMVEERVVRDVDFAYKNWLENPDDPPERWTFTTVNAAYALLMNAKDNPVSDYKQFQSFIIKNASRVCRMASISDSGAGQDILELKKKSLEHPGMIFFMARERYDDVYVKDGEQIIFYKKNIRKIEGKLQATKQITNIWNDIPWEGIAKEGGVSLKKSKKPERLIQRILTIASNPGDLVLDSFLGSGTTAAAAQKMGRRWIGIEMGEHAKTHCAVRMKKVIDGEQGGISKAVNWKGGGSFRFYELGEAILKKDGTLTEDIPFEVMAAHVWFTQTKRPYGGAMANGEGEQGKKSTVLGVHGDVAFVLLYNGILGDRRVSGGNVLTKKTLKIILDDLNAATTEEERGKLKEIVVYAEASRLSEDTLKANKIEFRQTPYDLVTRK